MDNEIQLNDLIDQLNKSLIEYSPYSLALVDPSVIKPVEKNAHYMDKHTFDTLSGNIKKDKNLSSIPFCWKTHKGDFIVLSGNHRVAAAVAAGVKKILILYTDADLTEQEAIAIQLSHNALVGRDEPNALLELWKRIDDTNLKIYSGLNDSLLDTIKPVSVLRFNEAALHLEEIFLLFVPSEIEEIESVLKKLNKAGKKYLADIKDFEKFFDALLRFKDAAEIFNTSTAIKVLIDIADAWISEHNAAEHSSDET